MHCSSTVTCTQQLASTQQPARRDAARTYVVGRRRAAPRRRRRRRPAAASPPLGAQARTATLRPASRLLRKLQACLLRTAARDTLATHRHPLPSCWLPAKPSATSPPVFVVPIHVCHQHRSIANTQQQRSSSNCPVVFRLLIRPYQILRTADLSPRCSTLVLPWKISFLHTKPSFIGPCAVTISTGIPTPAGLCTPYRLCFRTSAASCSTVSSYVAVCAAAA
jgi:hypothetical protein